MREGGLGGRLPAVRVVLNLDTATNPLLALVAALTRPVTI
jgi:hypothetical protein